MQVGKGDVAGKGVHRAVLQGRLPGQAVLGGGQPHPLLWHHLQSGGKETWTSQQTAQIPGGNRVDTHGALGLLERGKCLSLCCGKGITEEVRGNWQAEVT